LATALIGFASFEVDHNRRAALAEGHAEAENLARVMSEQVQQVLEGAERTLTLVKLVHEHQLASPPLATLAAAMKPIQGTEAERRINLFDRDGRFVASTDPQLNLVGVSIEDRHYFRQARAGNEAQLYIGEPVVGRVSKRWILPVAKRLQAADGGFDGIAATAIDPHRLVHLFRALRVGERSSVGIAHRDGPVIAWAQATTPDAKPPGTIGEVVQAERVVALSAVVGSELISFASLSEEELLVNHRRFALAMLGFVGTTLAAVTLPIWWLGRRAWQDVHRRRLLELSYASAQQQARTDPLTGLANRTGFDEARRSAYEELKRNGTPFALAFVDIDHFKRLNDSLGHEVGDDALRFVAETLIGGVRQSDVVGRLGGDEFAVLMPAVTAATMHRRFDPIKVDLDAMVARQGWRISFSIGVVAYESATPRARDAVNLADRMMYDAKGAGRDAIRYAVFRDGQLLTEDREAATA
jgi:diguanylate cyclase (GGDEF)-like protein